MAQFHLTGEHSTADDMATELERIAAMLREGFTSGEVYLCGGWWRAEDLDDEDEDEPPTAA